MVFGYGGLFAYGFDVTGVNKTWEDRILWEGWIVHNPAGSPLVSASMKGTYLYTSSDGGGIQCKDAVTGETLSTYQGLGIAMSSPTIWEGKLYIGHGNRYMYCFDDRAEPCIEIWANQDKGAEMWIDETITVSGGVHAVTVYDIPEIELQGSVSPAIYEEYYPPIPNAEVTVIFVDPDGNTDEVTVMADEDGMFVAQFVPETTGEWSWTAWYPGEEFPLDAYVYPEAYTEYYTFTAIDPNAPSNGGNGGETPPPETGLPVEYIYAGVAVVVIVIVVLLAYLFLKRRR
jgi:hypothetical protein